MQLKAKLARNALTIGSWITLGHPSIADIMAAAGFDWLVLDTEHSVLELGEVQMLIQVLDPVLCRMAAAISGAGPPAITDASW